MSSIPLVGELRDNVFGSGEGLGLVEIVTSTKVACCINKNN
jgi:hypothetical protein